MRDARPTNSASIDLSEFRGAWRIVLVAMLGLCVSASASLLYSFGSLVIPLQHAIGWSRADLQPAVGFMFGGTIVSTQLVGWLNDRWGMRRVSALSLAGMSACYLLMTQLGHAIGWLYLLCTLLALAGVGATQVTWSNLIVLWFSRNRGLALAAMLSGTGLSAMVYPQAVTWAISRWNWQGGFVLLGLAPLAVLPLALAWMKLPSQHGKAAADFAAQRHDGLLFRTALRSARFWTLNLALALVVAAVVAMISSTIPLLRDKGLDASDASRAFGGFGISLLVGRLIVGYLFDRLWAPGVAAVTLALPALGCALLGSADAQQTGLLTLATMLVGVGAGAEFDIGAYLVARYFGMRDYGRLFGLHVSLITCAATLSPWFFGHLYASTGTYATMLAICGGAFVSGALLLLPLGRYPKFDSLNLA
ncbi:MFS transporter [Paraburkholderia dinghuensis]|nr:MFS transporter [Paraburkholderia dinghuensis]